MMTQEDYKLWTNSTTGLSEEEFQRVVANASGRLASYLCLSTLPTDEHGRLPDDLQELLANFICSTLNLRGGTENVSSKKIRNFTISFRSSEAENAWAAVAGRFGDIIDKYSQCGLGFACEKTKRCCNGCV